MEHSEYGLTMRDYLWRAHCACRWESVPSPSLDESVHELDGHLRKVVAADQRPSRVGALAAASVLRLVDHTLAVGVLALGLAAAGAALSLTDRRLR